MESEEWKAAISSEMASLKANDIFKFVSPVKTHKTTISILMILQNKLNEK